MSSVSSHNVFIQFILLTPVCAHVCAVLGGWACTLWCMCRNQRRVSGMDWILSYPVGPRDETQVAWLDNGYLFPLNYQQSVFLATLFMQTPASLFTDHSCCFLPITFKSWSSYPSAKIAFKVKIVLKRWHESIVPPVAGRFDWTLLQEFYFSIWVLKAPC